MALRAALGGKRWLLFFLQFEWLWQEFGPARRYIVAQCGTVKCEVSYPPKGSAKLFY